ncbi:MAG: hypothetical protein ABIO65_07170 [Nitrospiria bacterium]
MFTARVAVTVLSLALFSCGHGAGRVLSTTCAGFDNRTDIGGTGSVSGSAVYLKRVIDSGGWTVDVVSTPIRFARTEVVSCVTGAVLGDALTAADGGYVIAFTNPRRVGIYVRVLSSAPDYKVSVKRSAGGPLYGVASPALDDAGAGETLSLGLAATSEATSGAFNILDQGVLGAAYLLSVPVILTRDLEWAWYPGSPAGTSYTSGNPAVIAVSGQADDPDQFDDAVLLHEYGHYVLDIYSKDDSPGGEHRLNDSSLDLRLAWSEGWASFFSSVVRNDPVHIDTSASGVRLQFELEGPSFASTTWYDSNELAVAAVLWDAFDGPGEDPVQVLFSQIWSTITTLKTDSSATTISFEDFWIGWKQAGFPSLTSLTAAFFIELESDSFETGDDTMLQLISVGSTTHHTLYPSGAIPGRMPADIDLMQFTAGQTGIYTVETSRCDVVSLSCVAGLSNGADTVLEVTSNGIVGTSDNFDGKTYGACGLNCPPNDAQTLSSRVTFTGTASTTYRVKVTRSAVAPPSAGDFGSYDLIVTGP